MGLATRLLHRNMKGMSLEITEELIARQSPEAQAIIRVLLAKIQELQDRLNQSPRNSSAPPSGEHPHAKPLRLTTGAVFAYITAAVHPTARTSRRPHCSPRRTEEPGEPRFTVMPAPFLRLQIRFS